MKEVKEFKEVIALHPITLEYSCNLCGAKVIISDEVTTPMTEICIEPGYGSKFDNDRFEIDLCDCCLEDFLKNLKIQAKKIN